MAERVRLFRDDERTETTDSSDDITVGPELGHLHVQLWPTADDEHPRWRGKIQGSDYLVWGMNHRRVVIEFESGERRRAVLRATGDLIGIGEPPTLIETEPGRTEPANDG